MAPNHVKARVRRFPAEESERVGAKSISILFLREFFVEIYFSQCVNLWFSQVWFCLLSGERSHEQSLGRAQASKRVRIVIVGHSSCLAAVESVWISFLEPCIGTSWRLKRPLLDRRMVPKLQVLRRRSVRRQRQIRSVIIPAFCEYVPATEG
jgi:hypothetical protein